MRYRLYPSKDTTIIEEKTFNTGLNQVGELWYGDEGITRHLMYFDIDKWVSRVENTLSPEDITDISCTLKIFNCYEIYETEKQARSVDVEICNMTTTWDEGAGFSFKNSLGSVGYANWYSATSIIPWTTVGGDFNSTRIFSGHIDQGNENISGNVDTIIQDWYTGGSNNGLMLKFTDDYETLTSNTQTILKFHTKNTNTYMLPYIQFDWDGQIEDDRNNIIPGYSRRLYLYTRNNGTYTNVHDISEVIISFDNDETPITANTIINQYPGIYYIDFDCPTGVTSFYDTWNVTYEEETDEVEISQSGVCINTSWETNSTALENQTYCISIPNIKPFYDTSSQRFLEVRALKKYTSDIEVLKGLQYRIDLVDGKNTFEMVDWESVSYTNNQNVIFLDTTWFLLNNNYRISFRPEPMSEILLEDDISRNFWVR